MRWIPPTCLPDLSQMLPILLPDASLLNDPFSMIPLPMIPSPWFLVIDFSSMILRLIYKQTLFGVSRWGHVAIYNTWCMSHRSRSGKKCGRGTFDSNTQVSIPLRSMIHLEPAAAQDTVAVLRWGNYCLLNDTH